MIPPNNSWGITVWPEILTWQNLIFPGMNCGIALHSLYCEYFSAEIIFLYILAATRKLHLPLLCFHYITWKFRKQIYSAIYYIREVLHGVGADGVGVKFPIFAVNCCCLPLSFRRRREKGKNAWKKGKNTWKKGKNAWKKGKITPTPSAPTPLRTSQYIMVTWTKLIKIVIRIQNAIISGRPVIA